MPLSQNIKHLRKRAGLTQSGLAEKLGLKRPVIGAYEEGRAEPRLATLRHMATFFQVNLDEFLTKDLSTGERQVDVKGESLRVLPVTIDASNDRERAVIVPEKAAAGYLAGYGDMDYIGALPNFPLPFPELSSDRTYRVFQIEGESMLPIPHGAYVICAYVQDWNQIKSDERYILLTKDEGIVFKKLRVHSQSKTYELISDNPEYKPYTIKQSQVVEVWKALGMTCFDLDAFEMKDKGMHEVLEAINRIEKRIK